MLENTINHSVLGCDKPTIGAEDLVFAGDRPVPARVSNLPQRESDVRPIREIVREQLEVVYEICGGNQSKMARLLEIPRTTLRDWLRKNGLIE